MKLKPVYFSFLFVAVLLAACGSGTPTAVPAQPTSPAEVPTEAPPTSGDPVWDRIQEAGRIEFGTSADYPPFEYYDASYEIVGFDAALAREIGSFLGLDVELVDIAFEGLPAALQIGQIDAAIAAISVSPERDAVMDFSNVYYTGQDMILARDGSGIGNITAPAQIAQYRVGVQRGSIYEDWVQNTLIATGLMPETNLLQYAKATDAVRDLRENRNDLVVLDRLAAEEYVMAGGVATVGQNLNTELYAVAIPQGSSILQSEINTALTELQNNGTIARLTEAYLDVQLPAVAPTPAPTPTAIPGPTATPVGCYDGMEFVRDVKVPDNTEMRPGQDFDKVWRVRNTGTCTWDRDYRLVFVQGDRMEGDSDNVSTTTRPGDTYDLIMDQKAPNSPGKYTGVWQMVNENGTPFGERIWVKIRVPDDSGNAPQPTAVPPTATSVPPTQPPAVQPTLAVGPVITEFYASSEDVQQGDLVTVFWTFSGEGLASAKITRTNPDGSQIPLYGGTDVTPQGQYDDLMMEAGTYTYTLNVSAEFGGSAVQTVVVNVSAE
jgi:polar amino acid transport system substrate-binding protein